MNSKLSFNWDLYQNSICNGFSSLQQLEEFVDMTLAADGHFVKVHQTLIALASPYLRALIKSVPTQHPVVFLDNVDHHTLCYILEYIYTGEVTVPREKLQLFTRAARNLCLTGIENILEKNKELMQIDAEYYDDSDYEPEEEITNTIKIDPLPKELVPQTINQSEEEQTNDDYFQPHADTIKIDIESELNIPYDTGDRNIFNNSTDNFENTLRQIPTPLLTPSGNSLGAFVNLKSPMPHLNVTPHDFNCDSNSSFHMEQFLKGLNPTIGENSQKIQNSTKDLTDEQTEVYNFTVQPISQKSMPMIDITNSKEFTLPHTKTDMQYSDQGYKGFKRLLTEDSISYQETNQSEGFKKIRTMEDDNSICFSPLLNLINNDDINVDNVAEHDTIPTETDNSNAIEELMSMPILDASPVSAPTEGSKNWQVQTASQIEITNTGELFVRPQNPGKIKSLRYHRRNKNKASSNNSMPSIAETCNIEEPIIPLGKTMAEHPQHQSEEPTIEIHIPETEENIDLTDLSFANHVAMPNIEIKLPPKKPLIVEKKQTEPNIPIIKIKIPDEDSRDRAKTAEISKSVTETDQKKNIKKMRHGVQIIKIDENLTRKINKSGDASVDSTPASGLQRIRIKKQETDISKVKVRKIKRITIRKAPGTTKPGDKDTELTAKSLGFKFKLPQPKLDTAPAKDPSETASATIEDSSKCEEDKDQETSVNQQTKEPKEKSLVSLPTINITHKDKTDIAAVNIRVPLKPDPNSSMVQYSVSQRGCLQIIVNRFMYRCHYTHSLKRRWRCIDYRPNRCPAYIDTDDDLIVERVNAHKHPFHDKQIWEKMRKNLIFTVITQAEECVRDQLRLRGSENSSDEDEDLDDKD